MNQLDASKYRIQLKAIEYLTKNKTIEESLDFIGLLAINTYVHIVICGHYLGELYGYTPEILAKIRSDMKFYNVDETIGLTCGKDPSKFDIQSPI